jgi:hypothetical protein
VPGPEAIRRLQDAGLLVFPQGPNGPFRDGYTVAKPRRTPGNTRPDYELLLFAEGPDATTGQMTAEVCDAPTAQVYPSGIVGCLRSGASFLALARGTSSDIATPLTRPLSSCSTTSSGAQQP